MRVAQVTAKIGETIVDLAHLVPGERYTIGCAPSVRLAISGLDAFPLVASEPRGFVVHRPVGLGTLVVADAVREDTDIVVGWERVTFEIGLVAIEIVLVERTAEPLPRPRVDLRTPAFVVGSLIAHLVLWNAAITYGRVLFVKRPRPVKQAHPLLVHLAPLPPPAPVPRPPPPSHSEEPAPPPAAASARVRATAPPSTDENPGFHLPRDRDGRVSPGDAIAALDAVTKPGDIAKLLDQVGPVYVPSAVDHPFGDNEKLDPKTRPGWGALEIHTGRYRTIGVHDPIPASQGLALCESRRCEVTGGLEKAAIQQTAATRGYDLQQCMGPGEDPTRLHRGAAVLELDIAPDGSVKKVRGQGAAARCAATVIASLVFPPADAATHATFTIGYP